MSPARAARPPSPSVPARLAGPRRPASDDGEGDSGVLTAQKTRTEKKVDKPKLYKVLLHNDDYTTMEFVVAILIQIFHHTEASATNIMLHIHQHGIGVAGVFTYEIAETKVAKVKILAREAEYPL